MRQQVPWVGGDRTRMCSVASKSVQRGHSNRRFLLPSTSVTPCAYHDNAGARARAANLTCPQPLFAPMHCPHDLSTRPGPHCATRQSHNSGNIGGLGPAICFACRSIPRPPTTLSVVPIVVASSLFLRGKAIRIVQLLRARAPICAPALAVLSSPWCRTSSPLLCAML